MTSALRDSSAEEGGFGRIYAWGRLLSPKEGCHHRPAVGRGDSIPLCCWKDGRTEWNGRTPWRRRRDHGGSALWGGWVGGRERVPALLQGLRTTRATARRYSSDGRWPRHTHRHSRWVASHHTDAEAQAAPGAPGGPPRRPDAFKAVPLCGSQDSAYHRTYRRQLRPSSQQGPRRPPRREDAFAARQHCSFLHAITDLFPVVLFALGATLHTVEGGRRGLPKDISSRRQAAIADSPLSPRPADHQIAAPLAGTSNLSCCAHSGQWGAFLGQVAPLRQAGLLRPSIIANRQGCAFILPCVRTTTTAVWLSQLQLRRRLLYTLWREGGGGCHRILVVGGRPPLPTAPSLLGGSALCTFKTSDAPLRHPLADAPLRLSPYPVLKYNVSTAWYLCPGVLRGIARGASP